MESTGESNKIQVSQMTADRIQQAGKGYVFRRCCIKRVFIRKNVCLHFPAFCCCCIIVNRHWLTARSEQVMAKGKGLMQTYWCDPSSISTDVDEKGRLSTIASSESGSEMCYEI
jgi:hypothetical protein